MTHIEVEPQGNVAVDRIDRPPANAMDLDLLNESHEVVARLRADEPAAVVITGRERFFSGGLDLKIVPTLDADSQRAMVDGVNRMFASWHEFPRPVVCAVNGHAVAGGLILALCGDSRVGALEGSYGLTELRAGVPYPTVALAAVRAELSPAAVRRLVLRADLVGAEEALRLGVFDEVAPAADVLDRGLAAAEDLAELPAAAFSAVKAELHAEVRAVAQRVIDSGSDPIAREWLEADTTDRAANLLRGPG